MRERLGIAVAALIIIGVVVSPSGASASDYQWQSSAFNDPSNKGRYTAHLTYGVPETDDRQLTGVCSPGSSGQSAVVVFGAPVGRMRNGGEVILELTSDDGQSVRARGEIYRPKGEESLSGILVRAEVDHPMWSLMQAARSLTYRTRGIDPVPVGLAGSSKAIGMFLDDCRGIFGLPAGPASEADNEENNVSSATSCRLFGKVKSRDTAQPLTIRFTNRSDGYRSVMWLDYDGQPKEYRNLNAGESYTQQTFVGHPWMVTDGPGNCKEVFVPKRGDRRFDITFQ